MTSETKSSAARSAYRVGLERGGDKILMFFIFGILAIIAVAVFALVYGNTKSSYQLREAERELERCYTGGLFSR